jgi:peroxiredoxin
MSPGPENVVARRIAQIVALLLFAAATLWINYQIKVNVQGGQGGSSVQEMGNVKVGQPAPDFSVMDLASNRVSLSSFRGQKAVLLDFWASWCGPCRMAMVGLQAIQDQYKGQGLEILSLNQREPADTVRLFIKRKNYSFHVVLDADGSVGEKYGVRGIPTMVLVDKKGVIQWLQVGYSHEEGGLKQAIGGLTKQ